MPPVTQVLLFGSLRKEGEKFQSPEPLGDLPAPTPLRDLLKKLHLDPDRIQLVMVNHKAVGPDAVIHPGDRVSLFPREYAIFADWKNFRF